LRDSSAENTGTTSGDHFFQFKDEIISFSFALSPFWENSKWEEIVKTKRETILKSLILF
jgi:hypothetical protein